MNDLPGALAEFRACLSIPVDETARDAQITGPVLVHADCRNQVVQIRDGAVLADALR